MRVASGEQRCMDNDHIRKRRDRRWNGELFRREQSGQYGTRRNNNDRGKDVLS